MKHIQILFALIAMALHAPAQEMSPEWYAAKDASWARTRADFPESAYDGPFKRRMLEIDEWAKVNDHNLYFDANKPWRLAALVQAEIEAAENSRERDLARSSRSPQGHPNPPTNAVRTITSINMMPSEIFQSVFVILFFGLVSWLGYRATTRIPIGGYWAACIFLGVPYYFLTFFHLGDFPIFACLSGIAIAGIHGARLRTLTGNVWISSTAGIPLLGWPFVLYGLLAYKGKGSNVPDENNQPTTTMNQHDFEVRIPEGKLLEGGYVAMIHNTPYVIELVNHRDVRCDAVVEIDGNHVGTWRIPEMDFVRIERPSHDTGRFTFFEAGTREARAAGIEKGPNMGLISVEFKPERDMMDLDETSLRAAPLANEFGGGGTGLSGESAQRFVDASSIVHDAARTFTIHLRLVAQQMNIRPLTPRSTPIPPPID